MANQIISVNRKKYAVGLFWQPVGVGHVARNYARQLARSIDKKLNLFTEYRAMVGLGSTRFGQRSGMASAAAEVVESLSEYTSFLAAFLVGRGVYIVAVRNGVILLDRFFDSETAARAEYVRMMEIPDWGALIAPGVWSMPRAVEKLISDVFVKNSRAVLRQISRVRSRMTSVILLMLFVLGVMYLYREPIGQMLAPRPQIAKINPELAAEYKRQIDEKSKELDAQYQIEKVLPPPPIVLPYEYIPDVAMRAQLCYKAMGFLMQPVVGWNQVWVECGETRAVAEFRRDFGTLGEFYDVVGQLMPGAEIQEQTDNVVRVSVALPKIDAVASVDERDAETIMRDVTTVFQSIDENVEVDIVVDTITNGIETVNLDVVEISTESKLVPMQFMQIFDGFGGVFMPKCTWDVAGKNWNYEVIIYAK